MRTLLLAASASLLFAARAAGGASPAPAAKSDAKSPPLKVSVATAYWLKTYSPPDFGAQWHLDLKVKGLAKKKTKLLASLRKDGCGLSQDLASFPSAKDGSFQQISCRMSRKDAEKALAHLKKAGEVGRLEQKDEDPAPALECGEKLVRLKADREAEGAALDRVPAVSELVEELSASLNASARAFDAARDKVLFNIVLLEREDERRRK